MVCAAIRKYLLSLLRFPFLSHVQVFWCEISLGYCLKCPYNCFLLIFSSCCCSVYHCVFALVLVAVVNLSLFFFMKSSSHLIDVSTLASIVVSPLSLSFLDSYSLSVSFLGCKALCIMSFLVLWAICWISYLVRFRTAPSILRRGQPRCLYLWWDSCYTVSVRVVSSFSWRILFNFFLSSLLVWRCPLPIFPSILKFPFLRVFWFFS